MHWIDPTCLPETRGKLTQFLLNPHGELDGFILDHARQVHFPPHLAKQVAKHIAIGDRVRIRGVKPRDADIVAAVTLTSAQGKEIADEGPHHANHAHHEHHAEHDGRPMDAEGKVVLSLHGPKGELRGALLEGGTSLRMPPHAAAELKAYLTPGAYVKAWGQGVKNRFGSTIEVDEIAYLVDAESLSASDM